MKSEFKVAMVVSIFAFLPAQSLLANTATAALTTCLAENTTGKERKELAKWVFVAMSAHPEIKPLSKLTANDQDFYDKNIALLTTKLLTETCKSETKTALNTDGPQSIEVSFGVLGELAMQELMTNPDVARAFINFANYLDTSKLEELSK